MEKIVRETFEPTSAATPLAASTGKIVRELQLQHVLGGAAAELPEVVSPSLGRLVARWSQGRTFLRPRVHQEEDGAGQVLPTKDDVEVQRRLVLFIDSWVAVDFVQG